MSVKKAIKILDWWIEQKKQGIKKLQYEWKNSFDNYDIEKTLFGMDSTIISNLETIRGELIPKR